MLLPQTSELTRNIEKECLTVSQLLLASGRINFFFQFKEWQKNNK